MSIKIPGLIFLLLLSTIASAQTHTYLFGSCAEESEQQVAYFLVLGTGGASSVSASKLAFAGDSESGLQTYIAKIKAIPESNQIYYWLVCHSLDQPTFVGPGKELNLASEGVVFADLEAVRGVLLEKKQILSDRRNKLEAKNSQLQRLKTDASMIGGYDRVALLSEEALELKSKVYELSVQNEKSQKDLERLQFSPAPIDLPVRERNIKQHLNKLAQAYILEKSRQKESQALQDDPQELADLANQNDLETLENQVNYLRMQRTTLERQYGAENYAPSPADSATPQAEAEAESESAAEDFF